MKQKLSVLFLCGWYPSRVLPNNGDFIQRHAEAVSKQHTVTVLHIISDKNCVENIELVSKKINGINTHIAYIKKTKNPLKKSFLFLISFKKLLQKTPSFNIVHLNEVFPFGIFSLYLKWFKKKQFIITEHWTGFHYPKTNNISYLQKYICKIIVRNARFICPVSNNLKESMQSFGLIGNYSRVPNVVNTNLFYPSKKTTDIFTITHVSNMMNDHKNIEGLLRVIAEFEKKMSPFHFNIIGENSFKYIDYAKKVGIDFNNISFIDQIPHKEIAKKIKESNVFVLFSNYENLPCVILESFSCGVPVISTNVGGINEFFPDDFGFLIDTKDEKELLNKIIVVKNNFVVDKNKMHNYVKKHFSMTKIATHFTELYKVSILKN